MKRPIKFRGRDVITGNWAYGFYYPSKGHSIIRDESDCECIVNHKTVGQFTGLHDKNGNPVYQGDILYLFANPYFGNYEVKFGEYKLDNHSKHDIQVSHLGWYLQNKDNIISLAWAQRQEIGMFSSTHSLEIIGNIYQNENLLTPNK